MLEGMLNGLSGLRAASKKLQNSANNVANIQTSGFKKSRLDLTAMSSGGGRVSATSRTNTQGAIAQTNDPFTLAISGRGFFQVALPNGESGFTRGGTVKLNGTGRMVTSDGNPVTPEITVPGNATGISFGSTGEVSYTSGGETQNAGQLLLADFNNPSGLTALGGNLLGETNASGAAVAGNPGTGGFGTVISGAFELSNVDITSEVVDQIATAAAFKANAQVIKVIDEITGSILDTKV